jgi:tripartite-type tricarboxylate transporter receptor subunit TctC
MFFEFFSSHQKSNLQFFCILFLSFLVTHLALAIPVDYPNKPVKIIVPVAPGGGVDLVARTIADRLTKALGQSFIVENQSGGGGAIGSQAVARASSDG